MGASDREHWDRVYGTKKATEVSWYRAHLDTSLALVEQAAPGRGASIVDVGGGESTLVDDLLARGYTDLTVLDVSRNALDGTRGRLGGAAERVDWICADVTAAQLAEARNDVWHDRAVFHFTSRRSTRRPSAASSSSSGASAA